MRILAALLVVTTALPASAEVVHSSANGFQVRQSVDLAISPQRAFQRFADIGAWWDDAHTYGGKGAAMTLELKPGGCFCETLENGGGVEHMRVVFVDPGKRVVLSGSLGPLLTEATAGAMDVRFEPRPGGSQILLDYRVAGFFNGGADRLAKPVDGVLAAQLKRLAAIAN
jgi:hypothetical protein